MWEKRLHNLSDTLGNTYRETVAKKCLEFVSKPTAAVKYVVVLNKRTFLWDVLWEYMDKFVLMK